MNKYEDMECLDYQLSIYTWDEPEGDEGVDEWGNPLPPSKNFIAQDLPADFQPLSGQRRVASSGNEYESSHKLYIFDTDKLTGPVKQGMKVDVKRGELDFGTYIVVFTADHMYHLEIEVKRDV